MNKLESLKKIKIRLEQGVEVLDDSDFSISESIDLIRTFCNVSLKILDEVIAQEIEIND